MIQWWLLVIDFPDERVPIKTPRHMHSWLDTEEEALLVLQLLRDQLPGDHYLLAPPAICPECGRRRA